MCALVRNDIKTVNNNLQYLFQCLNKLFQAGLVFFGEAAGQGTVHIQHAPDFTADVMGITISELLALSQAMWPQN